MFRDPPKKTSSIFSPPRLGTCRIHIQVSPTPPHHNTTTRQRQPQKRYGETMTRVGCHAHPQKNGTSRVFFRISVHTNEVPNVASKCDETWQAFPRPPLPHHPFVVISFDTVTCAEHENIMFGGVLVLGAPFRACKL